MKRGNAVIFHRQTFHVIDGCRLNRLSEPPVQTIKEGTEKEKQESWVHDIVGSDTLLQGKGRKVLGENFAPIWR